MLVIFIVLIVLNLYSKKSKIAFTMLLTYLWILFGWSYGNADWHTYINRYANYQSLSSFTEPVFTGLIKIGHLMGLDYRGFLIVLSGVCLLLIARSIVKCTQYPGFVLALYSVFSFPIDVTQVRFFVASSIIIFGFQYLLAYINEKQKHQLVMWLVTVILGACVHLSTISILVFLIPIFFGRSITILATVIVDALLIGFSGFLGIFYNMVSAVLSDEKMNILINVNSRYTSGTVRFVWFKMVIIFLGFILIYVAQRRYIAKYPNSLLASNVDYKRKIEFALDCNIAILVGLGLVVLTTDFYRIQQIVVMMNYFVFSNTLLPRRKGMLVKQNVVVTVVATLFAFLSLYYLVLHGSNYERVFYPLFNYNVLLH